MKKILLTIFTIILILSINVLAIDIDVGSLAIDRSGQTSIANTHIDKANPANLSGKITKIAIHTVGALTDFEVASFFVVSGNNLSTRNTFYIGNVAAGYSEHIVDLDIEAGDYIGWYASAGRVDTDTTGVGMWRTSGDYIPCTNQAFSYYADYCLSVYGTGTTAVGWDHKWNTQTISKWNTKEFTKWNGLE